ncbi:hypothetical protein PV433_18570 [Paenibacillus sp. GYB004]|uniref:hypothetical protein n=1 Tax=Paenibacillus sp. GYB004 TaxID=2994393 RepID=UPI002F961CA5
MMDGMMMDSSMMIMMCMMMGIGALIFIVTWGNGLCCHSIIDDEESSCGSPFDDIKRTLCEGRIER